MKDGIRRMRSLALIVLVAVAASGCTVMSDVALVPQSNFSFPNANVVPIGSVTGKASAGSMGFPDLSADLIEKAYRDALSKKGGDILINAMVTRRAKVFVLIFFSFFTTTVEVEGTAAQMTVGKQQLGAVQQDQIRRLAADAPPPVVDDVPDSRISVR